jgi:hypothetical protein
MGWGTAAILPWVGRNNLNSPTLDKERVHKYCKVALSVTSLPLTEVSALANLEVWVYLKRRINLSPSILGTP